MIQTKSMFSIVSWSLICCYRKKEHQEEESKSEEESESEIEEETEESCIPSVDWYSSLAEEEEEVAPNEKEEQSDSDSSIALTKEDQEDSDESMEEEETKKETTEKIDLNKYSPSIDRSYIVRKPLLSSVNEWRFVWQVVIFLLPYLPLKTCTSSPNRSNYSAWSWETSSMPVCSNSPLFMSE